MFAKLSSMLLLLLSADGGTAIDARCGFAAICLSLSSPSWAMGGSVKSAASKLVVVLAPPPKLEGDSSSDLVLERCGERERDDARGLG